MNKAVALFWVTVGIVVYAVAPEHRQYIVSLNGRYLRGAITHAILLATLFASAAHLVSSSTDPNGGHKLRQA